MLLPYSALTLSEYSNSHWWDDYKEILMRLFQNIESPSIWGGSTNYAKEKIIRRILENLIPFSHENEYHDEVDGVVTNILKYLDNNILCQQLS